MTTTNGTRALHACLGARKILVGSFLNMDALIRQLGREEMTNLVVVGAGTFEEAAYEDTLAAGAVCDALWGRFQESQIVDSARVAREIYCNNKNALLTALLRARNGRRLQEKPGLGDDVPFCGQQNIHDFTAELKDGAVRKCF